MFVSEDGFALVEEKDLQLECIKNLGIEQAGVYFMEDGKPVGPFDSVEEAASIRDGSGGSYAIPIRAS